jgi:hypothetical protein
MLLMGLATAHICFEAIHVEERRPEAVLLRTPYVFGSHEDRAAEFAVDLHIFARQVVAVATPSARVLDWLPQDASNDVVVQAGLLRQRAAVRSQIYEAPLVRIVIGNDKEIV